MKKIGFFILFISVVQTSLSQEKNNFAFITGTFNTTFTLNKNYVIFDSENEETLLEPAAILLRLGIGYQFNRRLAALVNAGFDHHGRFGINAIPAYGTLRYNIIEKHENTFFTEASYGKMWRPSSKFSNGNYYAFGFGWRIKGDSRWNFIVKIEYHRKAILNFNNGHLDSLSIGLGFSFF
ncbi:MAG: hypothetical protein ACWIPJ_01995 [Polaribacter sp.]